MDGRPANTNGSSSNPVGSEPRSRSKGSSSSQGAKHTLDLELFGQRITVVSDNDVAVIQEIVAFVNDRMESIRSQSRRAQTEHVALLAALNIAEELFEARQENRELKRRVKDRAARLLNQIDQVALDLDLKVPEDSGTEASGLTSEGGHVPLPGA